jgi:hypothetical protein
VQFVFDHVKSKLPEGLGSQLEGLMGQGGATAEGGGGLMDKLKTMGAGMMGNE